MADHRVRALLMGGQACVFYGGAEFSRDTDLLILRYHHPETVGIRADVISWLRRECKSSQTREVPMTPKGYNRIRKHVNVESGAPA
jgi:hypothetical protein